MSLEAPATEMASLQVFVGWHPKAAVQTSVEHPEKPLRKTFCKIGVDLGPEGGVDLAWIFGGREKRPEKVRGDFGTKFVTKFVTKCVTKFVSVSSKIRDRIRAAK